jgi:hypothetical protein
VSGQNRNQQNPSPLPVYCLMCCQEAKLAIESDVPADEIVMSIAITWTVIYLNGMAITVPVCMAHLKVDKGTRSASGLELPPSIGRG